MLRDVPESFKLPDADLDMMLPIFYCRRSARILVCFVCILLYLVAVADDSNEVVDVLVRKWMHFDEDEDEDDNKQ